MKRYYIFVIAMAVFCALAVGTNALARKGPVHDNNVVADLSSISADIEGYATNKDELPATLAKVDINNPKVKERAESYTYAKKSRDTYELCAEFLMEKKQSSDNLYVREGAPDPSIHTKGKNCFTYKLADYILPTPTPTPYVSYNQIICGVSRPATGVYVAPQAISAVADKKITVGTTNQSSLTWTTTPPVVYDASCKQIEVSSLAVGNVVRGFAVSGAVTVLQKQ